MELDNIIREFRSKIEKLYGGRFRGIVLYGSWARGTSTEDSDIDLAVILKGKIRPGLEIDRMINIITELNLKYNILLSVYPVSEYNYKKLKSPLLMNIRREGITA